MSTILLIRHGESIANRGTATSYPQYVKLTDRGVEQAKAIAKFLQEAHWIPELIITSSYLRTKQTAEPTQLAFPGVPEEEWPVQEFTYLASLHELPLTRKDRLPSVQAYWDRSDPSYVDPPKSESFEQFIARVRKVKEQLEQSDLAIIALFSHGQFINAFRWLLQNEPGELSSETMKEFRSFLNKNCIHNGTIVAAKFHKANAHWQYEEITSHLGEWQRVLVKK